MIQRAITPSMLDLRCGNGHAARLIETRGRKFHGVGPSVQFHFECSCSTGDRSDSVHKAIDLWTSNHRCPTAIPTLKAV